MSPDEKEPDVKTAPEQEEQSRPAADPKPKPAPKRRSKSKPKPPAREERDEALQSVRAVREANERRVRAHSTTQIERTVETVDGTLDVVTADGLTYLGDHRLDRDQLVTLQQALAAAFQAVS